MKLFNRQGRTLLIATAVVMAGFASGAVAQGYDTAYVPFLVNVDATVSAVPKANNTAKSQISVLVNQVDTLRIPIRKTTSIQNVVQRHINTPAIISNRSGKVSINLPEQTYRNAEVLLYTVNGKRVLSSNISTANNIIHPNLATGVYLLSVMGDDGNIITSRLTHNGGRLNISVAFGNENLSDVKRLAKETATGEYVITVSSGKCIDTMYILRPVVGMNTRQNILLRSYSPTADAPSNVTATATSSTSITVTWSAVSVAKVYHVYRSTTPTGTYNHIANTTSTQYTDSGLSDVTMYYYKVFASDAAGVGYQSVCVSVLPRSISVFTDNRDNNTYKTVEIGGKVWMAENLKYGVGTSGVYSCYDRRDDNCKKYGMLYDWCTAAGLEQDKNGSCSTGGYSDIKRQGICPSGWHLPSRQEWNDLVTVAGGQSGRALKSTSGWDNNGNGMDELGFSALPGGLWSSRELCIKYEECVSIAGHSNLGKDGYWWTATDYAKTTAPLLYFRTITYNSNFNTEGKAPHRVELSVRCVKDD